MIVTRVFDTYIKCDKCHRETILVRYDCITQKSEKYANLDGWRIKGEGVKARHYCRDCADAPAKRREPRLKEIYAVPEL